MGQSKKNYIINPDFDHFKDSIRYMMNSLPKKIDPMVSRTYMPGYDLGDWLTLKKDKEIYIIIQITDVSIENKLTGVFYTYENGKDELFIYYKTVQVKEEPEIVDQNSLRRQLHWAVEPWNNNCVTYSNLLKDYRPLTDTEKLLYAKED